MTVRKYFLIVSLLFALVSLVHLLIILNNWTLRINDFVVPRIVSYFAVVIIGFLSYSSFVYWHHK